MASHVYRSQNKQPDWFDDYAESAQDLQIEEYDITATPNDFNVMSLHGYARNDNQQD